VAIYIGQRRQNITQFSVDGEWLNLSTRSDNRVADAIGNDANVTD